MAIKVLRPDLARDRRRLERFKQELVLARQVSHPNVVRIHDIGSDGDLIFLTHGLRRRPHAEQVMDERGRLPVERAVVIARQLAAALAPPTRRGWCTAT